MDTLPPPDPATRGRTISARPLHVCYVTDERFPSTHTDTQQVAMTVDALARTGMRIGLVAPRYLCGPHALDQDRAMRSFYGVGDRFSTHFVATVDPERRAAVKTLHPAAALREVGRLEPDLVYTRNLQIALLALWQGYRVLFESYRIVDRQFPRLAAALALATRLPRFVGVITHSRVSAEAFLRIGVPDDKVCVIHNGYSPEQMLPELDAHRARELCGLQTHGPLAVYTGHINARKGIGMLARIAAQTPALTHIWVGGDARGATGYAEARRDEAGATNVVLTGWVPGERLPAYLYAADMLLIPPTGEPLRIHGNTVLPMKTFAYLAAGRAIVAPKLPDLQEVLDHDVNAWLVPPDDVDAAARALQELGRDAALRRRLGEAARASAQAYTWDARAAKIRAFLQPRLAGRSLS